MARKKKVPFPAWQTLKPDGVEERYIRLGNSQLLHEKVNRLTHSAFRVYVYMLLESGGKREFTFPRSKYERFISRGGAHSAICELEEAGFIEVLERNFNLRKANVYRFSERWKRI